MDLEIIFEDDDIIVCYKPAGVATETGRLGQKDMVSMLRNYRAGKGESTYIGMVHRLDQPVEGLLVFGKTQAAAAELSRQVQKRSAGKCYYAVARKPKESADLQKSEAVDAKRQISAPSEEIDAVTLMDYILFDKRRNVSSIVPQGTPQAKTAVLDYRIIGESARQICFDVTLHTGRHHQIRLQMAHHGFPLVGDSKYGMARASDGTGAAARQEQAPARGQPVQLALCAYRLNFLHPTMKREMDFRIRPHNEIFFSFLEPCEKLLELAHNTRTAHI